MLAAAMAGRVALWRPFEPTGAAPDDGFVRVSGVIHVHTTLSDGGGTPEEVIAAARAAGLDFVAITDHGHLDAKALEGYHDGVLVIVGTEISTDAGHVIALRMPDPGFRFSGDVRDGLDDVRYFDGIAFAAHPWSPRDDLRWTGWDLPGPWGLELMNIDSAWRRASWPRLALGGLLGGLNRHYAMLAALNNPGQRLAEWDALLSERDVPGILGTDAHSHLPITENVGLRFPSYESLFTFARNHVLLDAPLDGDATSDTATILDALRRGSAYVSIDALAPGEGFSFTLETAGQAVTMGETAPVATSRRLVAGGRLPAGTRLRLLRDGVEVAEAEEKIAHPVPGPGAYRVEARLPGWEVPWIVSNAIYVHDADARAARVARAAWPGEPEPPPPVRVLDAFEEDTIFTAGFDESSWMRSDILDPTAGPDGSGAGRMEFRLGAQGSESISASCEIASREPRDLTGLTGVTFSIRSDTPYRLWVQVRDRNPALAESTESWAASVRTAEAWRRVAIPFTSFRSEHAATDGRLDLDQVEALVFLVDRGAVDMGTSGTIWIDDVGVY